MRSRKRSIIGLAAVVALALTMPAIAATPSHDPADYLAFDSGDIAADGLPGLDGEGAIDHGWEPGPAAIQPPTIYDAFYDTTGPVFDGTSIHSPAFGTNIRLDLGGSLTDVTMQAQVYDNLDASAYTNVRYNAPGTTLTTEVNGGEIAIWTDDRPGRGGSVDYYSVWDGAWHTTAVERTLGWHTFTIHIEGTRTDFYIDGQLVHSDSGPRASHITKLGLFSSAQASGYDETQEVWFDDVLVWSGSPDDQPVGDPTTKDECKNGGWEDFGFKNQGQCIRFVNTGKDSRP